MQDTKNGNKSMNHQYKNWNVWRPKHCPAWKDMHDILGQILFFFVWFQNLRPSADTSRPKDQFHAILTTEHDTDCYFLIETQASSFPLKWHVPNLWIFFCHLPKAAPYSWKTFIRLSSLICWQNQSSKFFN